MISIVACCHGAKLCAHAARDFRSQHHFPEHLSVTDKSSTGVAPITVEDSGNNVIVIVAGANLLLSASDIDSAAEVIKRSKVFSDLTVNLNAKQTSVT